MKSLPDALEAKLLDGVTTLARAWVITRLDGLVVGMTEHDRDVMVNGVLCQAAGGALGHINDADLTFAPGRTGLSGALDVAGITQVDLRVGRFDGAKVEAFWVDWENSSSVVAMWTGNIAAVQWRGAAFELEITGPEAALSREIGRVFARTCDASLGDARCKADMSVAGRSGACSIISVVSDRSVVVSPVAGLDPVHLVGGRMAFTDGQLNGLVSTIASVQVIASGWQIGIAAPMAVRPSLAVGVQLQIGCDKQFTTCGNRFLNRLNFRGCPNMPGDDAVFSGPSATGNTGGAR